MQTAFINTIFARLQKKIFTDLLDTISLIVTDPVDQSALRTQQLLWFSSITQNISHIVIL